MTRFRSLLFASAALICAALFILSPVLAIPEPLAIGGAVAFTLAALTYAASPARALWRRVSVASLVPLILTGAPSVALACGQVFGGPACFCPPGAFCW